MGWTPIGKVFTMKAKNGRLVEYKIFDQDVTGVFYHKVKNFYDGSSMNNQRFLNMVTSNEIQFKPRGQDV